MSASLPSPTPINTTPSNHLSPSTPPQLTLPIEVRNAPDNAYLIQEKLTLQRLEGAVSHELREEVVTIFKEAEEEVSLFNKEILKIVCRTLTAFLALTAACLAGLVIAVAIGLLPLLTGLIFFGISFSLLFVNLISFFYITSKSIITLKKIFL